MTLFDCAETDYHLLCNIQSVYFEDKILQIYIVLFAKYA